MRPTATNISTKGGFSGQNIALSIDETAMQHLMGILTDLYSDPALAVIREYSCNALDSHVEAGNKKPIEISTPNRMSPYFKVRDYGVGLDTDGIVEIYSKYGASTKRNTDDQIGMLGVGCKSGLTYTDQVVINAVKGGKKHHAVLMRNSSGAASIKIVDITDTTEPNGVEIVIAVKDMYDFNSKITEFFKFWQPGTVLIDGKPPTGFAGMEKLAEGIYMDPSARGDYVVMGNVPYSQRITTNIGRNSYRYNYSVVVIAPVGAVEFTPSREHLNMTPRTTAWVAEAGKRFDKALEKKVNDDISKAATPGKAMAAAYDWQRKLGNAAFTPMYQGKIIPFNFYIQAPNPAPSYGSSYSRGDTSGRYFVLNEYLSGNEYINTDVDFSYPSIASHTPQTAVVITGWEMKKFTSLHVRKIRMYLEKMGLVKAPVGSHTYGKTVDVWISRNPDIMAGGWLDEYVTHIKWEDITTMKLPRQKKAATPTYYVHTKSTGALAFIDDTKPIFYKTSGWNGNSGTSIRNKGWLFETLPADSQVVILSDRRVTKFVKTYPNAVELSRKLTQLAQTYVANMPKDVLDKLANEGVSFSYATERLDHTKVVDPDLAAELRLSNFVPVGWDKYREDNSYFRSFGVALPVNRSSMGRSSKFEKRYPLLKYLGYNVTVSETLEYIEMVYNKKYANNGKGI